MSTAQTRDALREAPNGLRGDLAAACFDPGAYVGPRGERTTDQWRADACIAGPLAQTLSDLTEYRTKVSALEAEVEGLKADRHKLSVALTSLTPGGSEFFTRRGEDFVADADACVAVVQGRRRRHQETMMQALRAEAEARALAQRSGEERDRAVAECAKLKKQRYAFASDIRNQAAALCDEAAAYFRRTDGHYDRAQAAGSYQATANKIRQIVVSRAARSVIEPTEANGER